MASGKRAILIVLDGFGIGKDSPYNAIQNARMPFYRELWKSYPHAELLTHGKAVGLPDNIMGNSEVGHMTMGAGRIIYQDLTRISNSILDRSFFRNAVIQKAFDAARSAQGRTHLMGLLSDGGVHSHQTHLHALLDFALEQRVPEVILHLFTDGRDTPPQSGVGYLQELLRHPAFLKDSPTRVRIASLSGRYYAMDRDKRWDRVQKAYDVLTGSVPAQKLAPVAALEASYAAGKTDEFVEPILLEADGAIREGDSVFFFNYRSDRAREISEAFTQKEFTGFARAKTPQLSQYAGMTQYDRNLAMQVAYAPQSMDHLFGSWLEERGLKQFRIAETEKYAHVTFFFNGGRESPFQQEDRILIPSPKDVATYDLKPEMSAPAVASEAAARIAQESYDFMLMNFANADMVGHTGNYGAAVRAMETLDQCLAKVVGAAQSHGYHVLLTADHGNAEEMCDSEGHIHTQHTLNPVPALWIAPGTANAPKSERKALQNGGLADVMPTLCDLMGLPVPPEVTGHSLLPHS